MSALLVDEIEEHEAGQIVVGRSRGRVVIRVGHVIARIDAAAAALVSRALERASIDAAAYGAQS